MGMIWVAYRRDRLYADVLLANPVLIDDLLEFDDEEPIAAKIASHLAVLDTAALRARFDPAAMSRADGCPSGMSTPTEF
ncbi:hypothetical protein ET989_05390 [Propioniciclava sinopodophylli]|uniref:Uncharacterized protein n=1 Tax=Propioniciclava sinopodophylli TaxID=1837344 RepID=A0A4Q9KEJ0_9ACTN|nr:hypothetical protein [Propioniciclava sinopodophylli]TBT85890.1 hypothetical protein ET989_05390 [Propioniciclava sinopodophylli]